MLQAASNEPIGLGDLEIGSISNKCVSRTRVHLHKFATIINLQIDRVRRAQQARDPVRFCSELPQCTIRVTSVLDLETFL